MAAGMTGKQFKKIRQTCGLTQLRWGRALGYGGENATVERQMRRFENEGRTIPTTVARLAEMFWRHGIPKWWDQ